MARFNLSQCNSTLRRSAIELRREQNIAENEPNLDSAIWCYGCGDIAVPPCPYHGDTGVKFLSPDQLRLDVCNSRVPKAGQGLLYRGDFTIEVGTMIGPYTGTFIPFDDYKVL